MRGVGYVVLEDRPEPSRVRFGYVDDDDIRAMARTYAAPPTTATTPATTATATAARAVPGPRREPNPHVYRPGRHAAGPLLPDSLANLIDGDTGHSA